MNLAHQFIHDVLHVPYIKPQLDMNAYCQSHYGATKRPIFKSFKSSDSVYAMYVIMQPDHPHLRKRHITQHVRNSIAHHNPWAINAKKMISLRADYAAYKMQKLEDFEYDVAEPAIAIIDKMLTKPERFHLASITEGFIHDKKCIIVDKDTQVKFVMRYDAIEGRFVMMLPSCFTEQENRVIVSAIWNVVCKRRNQEAAKERAREEKRKQAFRDELMSQYNPTE